MLLPFMGLFMFFIPLAGFLSGMVLLFISRLRFIVPFAFLVPFLASYAALAGLWGVGLGLERLGFRGWIVGIAAWLGFVIGGGVGGAAGLGGGVAVTLAVHRLKCRH
jgi:hypothetical protein